MAGDTLGHVAMYAYQKRVSDEVPAWQAVADAVIAEYERRRWRAIEWQELQFTPTSWDDAGASVGKWKNGRWLVVHGITFASTAHEMGFTHFCIPTVPAPPKEGEV